MGVHLYTNQTSCNMTICNVDMLQGYPGGYQAADNTAQMHQLTIQNAGKQQPILICQPCVPYHHIMSVMAVNEDWICFSV